MSRDNLLIVFAKNPETEPVKTRLAKRLGQKAQKIYEKMLLQSINTHSSAPYKFKLFALGEKEYFLRYLAKDQVEQQVGNNLGKRMFNALEKELCDYKKVMITGSDILLDQPFIKDAFKFEDCVVGPSCDGGYYLVGLSRIENIFQDIPWSTPVVLEKTKQLILQFKLNTRYLQEKRDLDDFEDYVYYQSRGLIK